MDLTLTIGGAIFFILGTIFTVFTYGEHILCSGTLAFIGIIIFLLGLFSSKTKSTNIQQTNIRQPLFYCKECGKPIYKNSRYCENCGTEFINK
jgi:hypothetical protein